MNEHAPTCPPLKIDLLTSAEQIDAIKPEWHDLSVAAARASCFSSPSYFQAWHSAASKDVTWSVLIVRRNGALIGVMPLMRTTAQRGPSCAPRHDFAPSDARYLGENGVRPFKLCQISPVVSIPCALIGPAPLSAEKDMGIVMDAVTNHLVELDNWDTFAVPTDQESGQDQWKNALGRAGFSPWVLGLGRTISGIEGILPFADIVAGQNRNFRKNIRRANRAAQQAGLTIKVWQGADQVRAKLPVIANVAGQSWKAGNIEKGAAGGMHIPYDGIQREFVEALVNLPNLDTDLTPVLAEAQIDGQPLAVLLSLRHGDRLTAILTFHNLTFHNGRANTTSPGLLLIGRMIDWAHEHNLAGYDLNLTQNWARHLTNHVSQQNIVVCYANTLRGRVFSGISRAARFRHKANT